jgi:hypothetical protein
MQALRDEELLTKLRANPGMRFCFACPLCDEEEAVHLYYSGDSAQGFRFGNFCSCNQLRVAKALLPSYRLKRGSGLS